VAAAGFCEGISGQAELHLRKSIKFEDSRVAEVNGRLGFLFLKGGWL